MDTVKHTPGPWVLLPQSFSPRIYIMRANYGADDAAIADVRDRYDAYLIAAAPRMLAALVAVTRSTEWSCMEAETQELVLSAISKSTVQGVGDE